MPLPSSMPHPQQLDLDQHRSILPRLPAHTAHPSGWTERCVGLAECEMCLLERRIKKRTSPVEKKNRAVCTRPLTTRDFFNLI